MNKPITKRELSALYNINRKLESLQRELAALQIRAYHATGPNYSGMPGGGGPSRTTENLAAEIQDLQAIIRAKTEEAQHERNRLLRWIADVDEYPERDIFFYRYVSGFRWHQVAQHIGGGNTDESVRKRHDRYLERLQASAAEEAATA